ncbi:class I SAM-dependent methyltransferase [Flavobacterium sp. RHBU_24]|uniref:class I SAM-dependent methyltransferase n=1 Tax=Flavobacterium sp. RHBU_24 TaxID=3391185 RepID=UPI003984F2BE
MTNEFKELLKPATAFEEKDTYIEFPVLRRSQSLEANAYYFGHPEWAEEYLTYCHRSDTFKNRWLTAAEGWDDKVVIDIGCGPGNIQATLQSKPKMLIGIDVAPESLRLAAKQGYTSVLADANNLPFKSRVADIVALNAALHHTENMTSVLKEAARLVKPGGVLITDHDPQHSAWNYKGIAKAMWIARLAYYRLIGHSFHKSSEQQKWALACETHHKPGHGVTKEFFESVLQPLGFDVKVYPHNHHLGSEIFNGDTGPVEFKYKLGNFLSGRNPSAPHSALTLMCVAKKVL